jgi:hypothetical protein
MPVVVGRHRGTTVGVVAEDIHLAKRPEGGDDGRKVYVRALLATACGMLVAQ